METILVVCPKISENDIWIFLKPFFTETEQLKMEKLKDGEGCKITSCRHNMFWDKLNLPKKAHETEVSLSLLNCMCLLDKELTLEDIGAMWGLTRERVRQIERDGIIKLLSSLQTKKHSFLNELDLNKDFIKKKLDFLRAKKNNKKG